MKRIRRFLHIFRGDRLELWWLLGAANGVLLFDPTGLVILSAVCFGFCLAMIAMTLAYRPSDQRKHFEELRQIGREQDELLNHLSMILRRPIPADIYDDMNVVPFSPRYSTATTLNDASFTVPSTTTAATRLPDGQGRV